MFIAFLNRRRYVLLPVETVVFSDVRRAAEICVRAKTSLLFAVKDKEQL